jgi:glycosyltransferase involved in cell wall biosynthesis
MQKKLAVVGTNGLPGRYGGWDQLLENMVEYLSSSYEITVYASKFNYDKYPVTYKSANLVYLPLKANGYQSIPYDIISIFHAAIKGADVVLVLGTSGCIAFPMFRLMGIKLVLNPAGAEWKRGKWGYWVKAFLKLSERVGVRWANYVVADNAIIQKSLFVAHGVSTGMIAYGGDHVTKVALRDDISQKYAIKNRDYCFKVCRIEPENNLDMILASFAKSGKRLLVVGNWNFSKYGVNLRQQYAEFTNISMLDPIYNQFELNELRSNCCLYIHGHSVGGTNPSLVEAMCLGLCVVAFGVNYNRSTTYESAVYFSTSDELSSVVDSIYHDELRKSVIGDRLLALGLEHYTWGRITQQYDEIFDNINSKRV